jgi:DNA helicase-2/ATP-dependent DNA helicase PcrA
VYAEVDDGFRFRVVDWKTNRAETADPLQLAIYRLAWAEANGVPVSEVDAVFYYVRTDSVVRPPDLPDRSNLERLLGGVEEAITLGR